MHRIFISDGEETIDTGSRSWAVVLHFVFPFARVITT
jgi:hypothetical protein